MIINSIINVYMYVFINYKKSYIGNCLIKKYYMIFLSFILLIVFFGFLLSGIEKVRGV